MRIGDTVSAVTQSDFSAPPPNVQVYESNPADDAGAALDQKSGRRLPFILLGVLVLLLAVAFGRRRRARR